jgi:hypothetical protein
MEPSPKMVLHQTIYEVGKEMDFEELILVLAISVSEKIVSEFREPEEQKLVVRAFYEDLKRITRHMNMAMQEAEKYSKKVN